jgi:hypothetical protein
VFITDDLSGVAYAFLAFESLTNQSRVSVGMGETYLISGTVNAGVWRETMVVPRYSQSGRWYINNTELRDIINNQCRWQLPGPRPDCYRVMHDVYFINIEDEPAPTPTPTVTSTPTVTPYPTYTLYPTYTPQPTYTFYPTYTPDPTYTPYPTLVPSGECYCNFLPNVNR